MLHQMMMQFILEIKRLLDELRLTVFNALEIGSARLSGTSWRAYVMGDREVTDRRHHRAPLSIVARMSDGRSSQHVSATTTKINVEGSEHFQ